MLGHTVEEAYSAGVEDARKLDPPPTPQELSAARYYANATDDRSTRAYWLGAIREGRNRL